MEINEAFAAQAIAVNRQMGWDTKKVKRPTAARSRSEHPIGASGLPHPGQLLHEMQKRDAETRAGISLHRRRHGGRLRR